MSADKEKQIEEKAKEFCPIYIDPTYEDCEYCKKSSNGNCDALKKLKKFIKNYYLKNSIVISKEEYEKYQNLKRDVEHSFEYNQGYTDGQKKGSKEMVEKFVKSIKNYDEFVQRADTDGALFYIDLVEWLYDIAKQFNIEIKE